MVKNAWQKTYSALLAVILCSLGLGIGIEKIQVPKKTAEIAYETPLRGKANDLWADVVIGKRDMAEIAPRKIVPYKVNNPGGVVVDRSVAPGRLYVWDSGNSRILGVDLKDCVKGPCSAKAVIGQASATDYGACNQDASFTTYPKRVPASKATLCGVSEWTMTVLEDKTFSSLTVDGRGNLYVPDTNNNRVLKYIDPFTRDTLADEVWGQKDFSGNGCNFATNYKDKPAPTKTSLCLGSYGGATLDSGGNLWVADSGNHRVLRYPLVRYSKPLQIGTISKTADLVLGQTSFTTNEAGNRLAQMRTPTSLRFDRSGRLYVVDAENKRVLRFNPPFSSGMAATVFKATQKGVYSLEIQTDGNNEKLYTLEDDGYVIKAWDLNGNLSQTFPLPDPGGGSLGFDTAGNLYVSEYGWGQDVFKYSKNTDGVLSQDGSLFSPPLGYNLTSNQRLEHPSWGGVATTTDQLLVADGRLLYWNNLSSLANGKPADGYVGTSSFDDIPDPYHAFTQIQVDEDQRVWVLKGNEIRIYQAPLSNSSQPIKTLSNLPVLGGGQISFTIAGGLAPTPHGEYLWFSEVDKHRVLRIKDPLTNPQVDIILGQKDLEGKACNRGIYPAVDSRVDLTMLCYPGAVALDKKGNLYVADDFPELSGNGRLLMFKAELFPSKPGKVVYAVPASKEFPDNKDPNPYTHMGFEPAFNSKNQMVLGYNPYTGKRFIEYYHDPTKIHPNNPSDYTYAKPDGQFNDYYGWPVAMTFDRQDNLYVLDANRGKVMIYYQPLKLAATSPLSVPSCLAEGKKCGSSNQCCSRYCHPKTHLCSTDYK